jgi:hypothetical protein
MFKNLFLFLSLPTIFLPVFTFGQRVNDQETSNSNLILPTISVVGQNTANLRPVTTYESPISNLDFDPRVDMQSRNMAEAQGDVSIRGGIFENTGFRVGSITLHDPQTGHYSTELPIAPEMLSEPRVYTGTDNALGGFNNSVGTVSYNWNQITQGGSATIGAGDNAFNFQRLHNAWSGKYEGSKAWKWGTEIETSRSESDGTIQYGDHDFDRTTGRIQLVGPNSQTDLFAGYQSKFFGWPELYAAPYGSNETENIKTSLFILNHRQSYGDRSTWEASTYYRRNNDHYIYNRFSPNQNFIHETKVSSIGLSGYHEIDDNIAINYSMQLTGDEINSTKLEEGYFTNRSYYKFSVLPEYRHDLNNQESITLKIGASLDDSNRDHYKASPIAEISWLRDNGGGNTESLYLSYAQATQVVGYGAIGGSTTGLFASNPDLAREISKNLEIGYILDRANWSLGSTLFYRWDENLVDWTYDSNNTSARSAKNVDIETFGLEIITSRQWNQFEAIASYTYLRKQEDYKEANIDGSFYALNFPEHRITLGFIWKPSDLIEIRMDNEWREQRENAIREGPASSTYSHLAASFFPVQIDDLEIFFAFDKPWDENFQDIPGTPGRGDQFSLGATYRW